MLQFLLNLSRVYKQMIVVMVDAICLPITFCVAVWLRHDGFNLATLVPYTWLLFAVPLISIPIFIRLGLYRAVIRFIDHKIVYVVLWGVSLSVVGLLVVASLTTHMLGISRGVFGIYWAGAIMYVTASRFVARAYFLYATGATGGVSVAIYGAGQAGSQLALALVNSREGKPVAFVDDNKDLQGTVIAGVKVYAPADLPTLIEQKGIEKILLALPSASKAEIRHILNMLEPLKISTLVTPPIQHIISGAERVEDVREIEIEDLLGRDQVESHQQLIASCIFEKCVMVTGAGGSIGSELCRQIILQKPQKLILLDISEFALYTIEQELRALTQASSIVIVPFLGSVLEYAKCKKILKTFGVDTLYHAAAYKHVPIVEHNPIEGVRNNVFGTLSIARAALATQVKTFVLISTDKAVRPTNVMGATKRLSELILQAFSNADQSVNTRFCMVRFGNVLGSSGSVVPLFRRQIKAGGPITLTHPEITRYFMTIPEAAQLVLQAGAMGHGGDVFVLDMGEPVKIIDLAKRMVHLHGLELKSDIRPEGDIELNFVGLRPGEKLFEELLIGDNVEGTEHPLIMRASEHHIVWEVLKNVLNELELACDQFDYVKVRELLQQIVPEYVPQCEIQDFLWQQEQSSL